MAGKDTLPQGDHDEVDFDGIEKLIILEHICSWDMSTVALYNHDGASKANQHSANHSFIGDFGNRDDHTDCVMCFDEWVARGRRCSHEGDVLKMKSKTMSEHACSHIPMSPSMTQGVQLVQRVQPSTMRTWTGARVWQYTQKS